MIQRAVWFEWPFGPWKGQTVRFFYPIGPFFVSQWGNEWRLTDSREANPYGGPAWPTIFATRQELERALNDRILHK